jgi:hypothetical protein
MIISDSNTSRTLGASDNGKIIKFTSASAITVTVPSGLGSGFSVTVIQYGAGQVSFTTSGTTINNRQSHGSTAGQYAVVSLIAHEADIFVLAGDTTT